MTAPENLVGAVCDSLATFADHVSLLPAEDYCAAVPELAGATIGQHVRHCIDHYVVPRLNAIAIVRSARSAACSKSCARLC